MELRDIEFILSVLSKKAHTKALHDSLEEIDDESIINVMVKALSDELPDAPNPVEEIKKTVEGLFSVLKKRDPKAEYDFKKQILTYKGITCDLSPLAANRLRDHYLEYANRNDIEKATETVIKYNQLFPQYDILVHFRDFFRYLDRLDEALSKPPVHKPNILSQKSGYRVESDTIFSSGIMIRIAKTTAIEDQFKKSYIRFGCPSNWINYAEKNPDNGIADRYEAVFAHVKRDDPRLKMKCDDGAPLDNPWALWKDEGVDDTVYVRYKFSYQVPTLCLYSLNIQEMAKIEGIQGNGVGKLTIDLEKYYEAMFSTKEDIRNYSILVISSPGHFVSELWNEVPKAIMKAHNVDRRFFIANNAVAVKYVKYDLNIDEEFWDFHPYDELFRKRPKYEEQHEARIIIPNVRLLGVPSAYKYNELDVPVPKLQSYSLIAPAAKCKKLVFSNFNEDLSRYTISIQS